MLDHRTLTYTERNLSTKLWEISCVGPTSPIWHNNYLTTGQFSDGKPWILAFMWIYLTQTLSLNMIPTYSPRKMMSAATEMALEQPEKHDQELRLSSSQTLPHDDQDPGFSQEHYSVAMIGFIHFICSWLNVEADWLVA